MSNKRAIRPDVRNPVLRLPSARALAELPAESKEQIRALLLDLSRDAATRAQTSWRKSKGPMAAYWKSVSVYARHIARTLRASNGSVDDWDDSMMPSDEELERQQRESWEQDRLAMESLEASEEFKKEVA